MLALLLLILILGFLIFIHEFGHYITAKNRGAYVYEFALGMGPKIFSFKRKKEKNDPTVYSIRLFPIGGFCAIAGETSEEAEEDSGVKLKKSDYMCNKKIWERCLILIAGVTMNFIGGFLILFISALIYGATSYESTIGVVPEGYPVSKAGIEVGDKILKIDGKSATNWDKITLLLNLKHESDTYIFKIEKKDGTVKDYKVKPKVEKDKEGNEIKVFGLGQEDKRNKGIIASFKYAVHKTGAIISSMFSIIGNLITGKLSLSSLSGPIGVYSIVDSAAKTSVESVLYLTAYLSLNLGFINIMPFPAFDGGRVFLLIIEAIRKKKMNPKIENAINGVGMVLLLLFMLIISIKDIFNLFA